MVAPVSSTIATRRLDESAATNLRVALSAAAAMLASKLVAIKTPPSSHRLRVTIILIDLFVTDELRTLPNVANSGEP
jgi:hypothetical protein